MSPKEELKAAKQALKDDALRQYLETALWLGTDDDEEPLDRNFSAADFTPKAVLQAALELNSFFDSVDVAENALARVDPEASEALNFDRTDLAHDFWLTRNGHGAGFWDKPEKYGALAEVLTALAKQQGSRGVYLTDPDEDGVVQVEYR